MTGRVRAAGWLPLFVALALQGCDRPLPAPHTGEDAPAPTSSKTQTEPTRRAPRRAPRAEGAPWRICIVSSYHREYIWSQHTQRGVSQALLDLGYLEDPGEARAFEATDALSAEHVVLKKLWLNSKRRSSRPEITRATQLIAKEILSFDPDLLLLGDDNAVNFVGNLFVDEALPVVFWGINGRPPKYGLIDELKRPGHNVTGVYQAGYPIENLEHLVRLVPGLKTFAVLSDDSPTGRSRAKQLRHLARLGRLPLKLEGTVITNDFEVWKREALALQERVDAFFVLNHNTIKDSRGDPVDQLEVGAWYLKNIKRPECATERQFAEEGLLSVVDDSGYQQGYEAMRLADQILKHGRSPAQLEVRAPEHGPHIVNRVRLKALGLEVPASASIDEFLDESLASELLDATPGRDQ